MIIILQTTVDAAESIRRSQKRFNPKNSPQLDFFAQCCVVGDPPWQHADRLLAVGGLTSDTFVAGMRDFILLIVGNCCGVLYNKQWFELAFTQMHDADPLPVNHERYHESFSVATIPLSIRIPPDTYLVRELWLAWGCRKCTNGSAE